MEETEDKEDVTAEDGKAKRELMKKDIDRYLREHFSEHKDWFNVPILPGITSISANNSSGFNDDPRSHRGDVLVHRTDEIGKRVSVGTPDEKKKTSEEGEEGDYYQRIDEEMQENHYRLSNDKGITWGDLMQAVFMAKGSKSDWWYELIANVEVAIAGNQLIVTFRCDHGS